MNPLSALHNDIQREGQRLRRFFVHVAWPWDGRVRSSRNPEEAQRRRLAFEQLAETMIMKDEKYDGHLAGKHEMGDSEWLKVAAAYDPYCGYPWSEG